LRQGLGQYRPQYYGQGVCFETGIVAFGTGPERLLVTGHLE